ADGVPLTEVALPPGGALWSACFSVPRELRTRLDAAARLRIGRAEHDLPAAADHAAARPGVDPALLAERRARRAEIAEAALSERARQAQAAAGAAEAHVAALERRL